MNKVPLAVVDMHWTYNAVRNRVLFENVLTEIEHAKRRGVPLYLVDYGMSVIDGIEEFVEGYKHGVGRATKSTPDGSGQLWAMMQADGFRKIRLVGVEFDYCVFQTAVGLKRLGAIVEVAADACNTIPLGLGHTPGRYEEAVATYKKEGIRLYGSIKPLGWMSRNRGVVQESKGWDPTSDWLRFRQSSRDWVKETMAA